MKRVWLGAGTLTLLTLAGCGKPDVTALQKMGCEQAATTVDLQSVKQLDALRKALGVAPDVDPVAFCESIGAKMTGQGAGDQGNEAQNNEAQNSKDGEGENEQEAEN